MASPLQAQMVRKDICMLLNRRKRVTILALIVALLLLVPLVAMKFTNEVNWTFSDFIFAGVVLFGTGLVFELLAMRAVNVAYRAAVGIAAMAGLLLIWINGAVGIIGDEGNPANMLYFGVLQIGIIGAALARLQPRGMALASYVTAIAQALVPVVALFLWRPALSEPPGTVGVFILNGFFVVLFVVSGSLFRQAGDSIRKAQT